MLDPRRLKIHKKSFGTMYEGRTWKQYTNSCTRHDDAADSTYVDVLVGAGTIIVGTLYEGRTWKHYIGSCARHYNGYYAVCKYTGNWSSVLCVTTCSDATYIGFYF